MRAQTINVTLPNIGWLLEFWSIEVSSGQNVKKKKALC